MEDLFELFLIGVFNFFDRLYTALDNKLLNKISNQSFKKFLIILIWIIFFAIMIGAVIVLIYGLAYLSATLFK